MTEKVLERKRDEMAKCTIFDRTRTLIFLSCRYPFEAECVKMTLFYQIHNFVRRRKL